MISRPRVGYALQIHVDCEHEWDHWGQKQLVPVVVAWEFPNQDWTSFRVEGACRGACICCRRCTTSLPLSHGSDTITLFVWNRGSQPTQRVCELTAHQRVTEVKACDLLEVKKRKIDNAKQQIISAVLLLECHLNLSWTLLHCLLKPPFFFGTTLNPLAYSLFLCAFWNALEDH